MHYLAEHASFNDKNELNLAVREHLYRNAAALTDTARITLKAIARYAVKFPGAAHLKAATVAELIGKSEKTARRMIKLLTELNIIEKVGTTRKVNGGKGANIIRILPPETTNDQSIMSSRAEAEKLATPMAEQTKNENEPLILIKQKSIKNLDTASIPASALKESIPEEIYKAMSPYFDADDLYKYYGILLRAKKSVDEDLMIENHPEDFVDVFRNTVLKYKRGQVRNLANYLFNAWQNAATVICRRLYVGM